MSLKRSLGRLLVLTAVISCLVFPTKSLAASDDVEINEKNFPDATFREILLSDVDKNKDNILSFDERYDISLRLTEVNDFTGMEYFSDVSFLNIVRSNVEKLDFDFTFSNLDTLMIGNCPELSYIGEINTKKKLTLWVYRTPKLESFYAGSTEYSRITFETCYNLKSVDLSDVYYLEDIDHMNCPLLEIPVLSKFKDSLKQLRLQYCGSVKNIDVSDCINLGNVFITGSNVETMNLSNCPKINSFTLISSNLKELDLREADCLNYIVVKGNKEENGENCIYTADVGQCSVPKTAKLITSDNVEDVKVSDIVEDSRLASIVENNCDTDQNKLLSKSEISLFTELKDEKYHSGGERITSFKNLNYFPNLRYIELEKYSFDTIDLGELPCTTVKIKKSTSPKFSIPDNTSVKELDFSNSFLGSKSIDLGHQDDMSILVFEYHPTQTMKVPRDLRTEFIDISDCKELVNVVKNGTKTEIMDKNGNGYVRYVSGDKYVYVNDYTRLKTGKDITVTASHGTVKGAGTDLAVGTKATLSQTPDKGYVFKGWYEGGKLVSSDSKLVFEVKNDRKLEARYDVDPSLKPTATPTAKATPTKQPTSKPTATPVPSENSQLKKTMEFVNRIYKFVLDREPEEEGAAFWSDELWSFRRTGAEVAQGFIFSAEFENRNTSDKEFVTILYKTFFGREAEEDGMNFWLTQLSSGTMDRITVANGFIYSQEWADTCASYGIRSGGDLKPNGKIEPTALTYGFVERLYTTALGRSYDEEGRQYWASELANFNITGENAGASFFLCDEMNGYGLSDDEFLGRLYATFMDREPDADGKAYWLGVMESGAPRSDVVFGFTRSPEFTDKCVEARILPY